MKSGYKFFLYTFIITLVIISVFRIFNLTLYLDITVLIVALLVGVLRGLSLKFSYKFFLYGMLTVLVIIGIPQFLNLPTYLDIILLILALLFGGISWIKKFKPNNNILGVLSLLTVLLSIVFSLINSFVTGPNVNMALDVKVITVLSVFGLFFAIVSKKLWFIVTGILLNGAVLIVAYYLLLAIGISEP